MAIGAEAGTGGVETLDHHKVISSRQAERLIDGSGGEAALLHVVDKDINVADGLTVIAFGSNLAGIDDT